MNSKSNSGDTVITHQGTLVISDEGTLIKEPVSVDLLGRKLLGSLIVIDDEGLVYHELVLVRDWFKAIDNPSGFLGQEARRADDLDDLDQISGLLEDRLKQLVEHSIAEVGPYDKGVYLVVLGGPRQSP